MGLTDPRVDIVERAEDPCEVCGVNEDVVSVEIDVLTEKSGLFIGDLCWDCLRKAYSNPSLVTDKGR